MCEFRRTFQLFIHNGQGKEKLKECNYKIETSQRSKL